MSRRAGSLLPVSFFGVVDITTYKTLEAVNLLFHTQIKRMCSNKKFWNTDYMVHSLITEHLVTRKFGLPEPHEETLSEVPVYLHRVQTMMPCTGALPDFIISGNGVIISLIIASCSLDEVREQLCLLREMGK